jgi:transposase
MKQTKSSSCARTVQARGGQLSRKERRELARQVQSEQVTLQIVHSNAAGIDVGKNTHYVAVPPDRDAQSVRYFDSCTDGLQQMVAWLKKCGITSVALQSTGVYWIALYDLLQEADFEVYLVNARYTKSLPGRKSDVQESQWLMKLHTYGLLPNSFRPPQEIRWLRSYWRQRQNHLGSAASCIHRMDKVLTEMNVRLSSAVTDLSGATGLAIIQAIVNGERDPHELASYRDPRVKATQEEIARQLYGNWQADLLFRLKQELEAYRFYQTQIAECDQELAKLLRAFPDRSAGVALPEETRPGRRKKKRGNSPQFDLRQLLYLMSGVDLARIDGIDVITAMTVVAEAGYDMSPWPTADHFVSWLRLAPDNRISGDKIIGKGRTPTQNRLTQALKMAASSLKASKTYSGAQYRRLRARRGPAIAVKAMAAKLARLVYNMLRHGMEYVDRGTEFYEEQQRERRLHALTKNAAQLGFQLVRVAS